jgi:hypothetical protein
MADIIALMLKGRRTKIEDYLREQASGVTRGTATWDERADRASAV